MQFPDLGNNCTQCNSLDFLPFVCVFCSHVFCKEHLQPGHHSCPDYDDNIVSVPSEEKKEKVRCKFCRQDITQPLERITCPKCHLIHCLQHRIPESHDCPKIKEEFLQNRPTTKHALPVDKVVNEPKVKGAKNEALARKVALMKLKQKARGPAIPAEERVYLFIKQDDKEEPLYFSRTWTIGKCVDFACSSLAIRNDSHKIGAGRWIFRMTSQEDIIDFSKTLSELITSEEVHGGDVLLLELVV